MREGPEWFAAKSHGYGSGLPVAWQGWALLIGFVAALVVLPLAVRSLLIYLSIVVPLTAAFLIICQKTTKGGWRWRWGGKD